MNQSSFNILFKSIETLGGVRSKTVALFQKILTEEERALRICDLLFILPHSTIDRRNRCTISSAVDSKTVTLEVCIDKHQKQSLRNRRSMHKVYAHDSTGFMTLIFFHNHPEYLKKVLPIGEYVLISGQIQRFKGEVSMAHPAYIMPKNKQTELPLVEPIYPLTAGLSLKKTQKTIKSALNILPEVPEWQNTETIKTNSFPSFTQALKTIHAPSSPEDCLPQSPAWTRLAYDELLARQILLALVRNQIRDKPSLPLCGAGILAKQLEKNLTYSLTQSQKKSLQEIEKDLKSRKRMLRLLQGDVGSGKTIIALLSMAFAVESGGQAALMAPTEILARQHLSTIITVCKETSLRIALITGNEKGLERKTILSRLEEGKIDIIVGTHAIFQKKILFKNLLLAVIDEQHRFGVHQRLALAGKGLKTHMLVMTATPIPRTLVLSSFGDMDVSNLTEKPPGRKSIQTITLPLSRLNSLIERIRTALENHRKIYWVCPLVEESDKINLTSATERFLVLQQVFGKCVGLVHGKMDSTTKNKTINDFKNSALRILVATSVIEIGIDVPDASIIIIEHAERFGLAQLHQLRGRVGRGDQDSFCILLYKSPISENARSRLDIMRKTNDGFIIAQEDLRLRGQGELLGIKQSGNPDLRIVELPIHADLIEKARKDARSLLEHDPYLQSERGQAIQKLLALFFADESFTELLQSG